MTMSVHRRAALLAAAGLQATPRLASAKAGFPSRQVRLVVPFPPGGATDLMERLLIEPMTRSLGQPAIVENRAGATGSIGAQAAARARRRTATRS
jgi:tripartite-type tricarboxylate transporter receptor subunit TctC